MAKLSLAYLKSLPTLAETRIDCLKIDTESIRVWLCKGNDGATSGNEVCVESYNAKTKQWEPTSAYSAV